MLIMQLVPRQARAYDDGGSVLRHLELREKK
jgi:hypothetical protein